MDNTIRRVKQAEWRGNPSQENEIKVELYKTLKDVNDVEGIFPIIKQNNEF